MSLSFFGSLGLLNERRFSLRDSLFSLIGNLLLFLNELGIGIFGNLGLVVIELSGKLCLHGLDVSLLLLLDLLLRFDFQSESLLLFLHFVFELRDLLALGEVLLGNGLLDEVVLLLNSEFLGLNLLFLLALNLSLLLLEFEILNLIGLLAKTSLELILLFLLNLTLLSRLLHFHLSLDLHLLLSFELDFLFSLDLCFLFSSDLCLLFGFDLCLLLSLCLHLLLSFNLLLGFGCNQCWLDGHWSCLVSWLSSLCGIVGGRSDLAQKGISLMDALLVLLGHLISGLGHHSVKFLVLDSNFSIFLILDLCLSS